MMGWHNAATATTPKKKKSGWHDRETTIDPVKRQDKSNQNALKKLDETGESKQFADYQKRGQFWNKLKTVGSGALDILNRTEYATAGAAQELLNGGNIGQAGQRAASEIFSGIGDIQGQKTTIPDVIAQNSPEYAGFQKQHPFASVPADLALSIGLDPTTFTGVPLVKGAGKLVAKGFKKAVPVARKVKYFDNLIETVGRSFDPQYLARKGGERLADITEGAISKGAGKDIGQKFYDIRWSEGKNAHAIGDTYHAMTTGLVDDITKMSPADAKNFILQSYGDIAPSQMSDQLQQVYYVMGNLENIEKVSAGKNATPLLENYFHFNPKLIQDLMGKKYVASGHARGLRTTRATFERGKVIKTGTELLDFLSEAGVKDDDLPEVIARMVVGRGKESINKIRQVRTVNRMLTETPELFREVPMGTKHDWSRAVGEGEALWFPSGNLRFFPQEYLAKNKKIRNAIDEGAGVSLSFDELEKMSKEAVGVTTNVKAYAVPIEILEDIDTVSKRMADPNLVNWWDKNLSIWKNFAIFSPFFHVRNFISSGAQNYVAGMKPDRYIDMYKVLTGNADDVVQGMNISQWRNTMKRYGVLGGSYIGQDVGETSTMLGKRIDKPFQASRWLGGKIEDMHRGSLFIDEIKKGKDPLNAAKRVKKFHFDYNELTEFERTVMRRALPFYSWSRKNIPLQIEQLFVAPEKYRNIQKLRDAINADPESSRTPQWWQEQDIWLTKFQDRQGNKIGLSVGLPYSDLNQVLSPDRMMGMTGPAGTMVNLATNYDPFMGENITDFPGQKEAGLPPRLKYAIEGFAPIAKRYGFDMYQAWERIRNKDPRGFYKLLGQTGVRLVPLTQTEEEKRAVYQLMNELRDYQKYKKQESKGVMAR